MFKKNLPNVKFIRASRKKPYPDGLNEIISVSEIEPGKICLVDDRLLTGCLSSIISGCYPILLTNPLINKNKNRLNEVFFNIYVLSKHTGFLGAGLIQQQHTFRVLRMELLETVP